MTLYEALYSIRKEGHASFHMPGHKYGGAGLKERFRSYSESLLDIDMTEIPGSDNLHHATGIIQKAQDFARDFYGAKETHYLVNGSTGGIMAMILGCFCRGDHIVISRDAHRSVHHAVMLGGLVPVYIEPIVSSNGVILGFSLEQLKRVYEKQPLIKGIVVTYPSYSGACTNLADISEWVHSKRGLVLVDEAHGAHLPLSSQLPLSAIELGADVVVQSVHKTLPAMTQTALLHITSDRVEREGINNYLAMLQSSSPSYVLMASIDEAIHIAKAFGSDLMEMVLTQTEHIRSVSREMKLTVLEDIDCIEPFQWDRTKLCLSGGDWHVYGLDGYALERELIEQGIQPEYAVASHVLLMTSIANTTEDFERLENAIRQIGKKWTEEKEKGLLRVCLEGIDTSGSIDISEELSLPVLKMLPCELQGYKSERLTIKNAVNRVSSGYIIPYPPGIPLLMPGEVVSEDIVRKLEAYRAAGHEVLGVEENHIHVIMERV